MHAGAPYGTLLCPTHIPGRCRGRSAALPLTEHRDLIRVEGKLRELVESVCQRGTRKGPSIMQLLHLKQLERSKTMFFLNGFNIGK